MSGSDEYQSQATGYTEGGGEPWRIVTFGVCQPCSCGVSGLFATAAPEWRAEIGSFDGKEETMMTALPLDTKMPHGISGLYKGQALLQASTFLTEMVKPGAAGSHGQFDDPEEADGWARRFYGAWVAGLSPKEYSALQEYKREGFRSLNRGLRVHDGDLSMLAAEDRLRAEGLDVALQKAPTLDRPVVVYRGRLPDGVLEAFEEGEEDTLQGQVFGDPAYTSTSLGSAIAREYGGSSRFPNSVGKITLPRGTKAGYVDAVLDKGQGEMLLPRETRVRIDKAYRKGWVYFIEGQLVPC